MTASQALDARRLIPGAFELNARTHRANRPAEVVPPRSTGAVHSAAPEDAVNVVAAPARPTSRLGYAAAILWDLMLVMAVIYGVAAVPALAVLGVKAAATFIATLGGH
jgi:hypothetical protein